MPNSNAYGFYPDRSKYNLEDNLALKDHQHTPAGLILPAGAGAGNLLVEDDGQGNLSFNTSEFPYGFIDPSDWDLSDDDIVKAVRDNLMALHMPESKMQTFSSDYATVWYWLKGGYIYWIYEGSPWCPNPPTLETKVLGYFKYEDGSPCPYEHAIGWLHPTMKDPSLINFFLTHQTSSSDDLQSNMPWASSLAIHKHPIASGVAGSATARVGSGVFKMTGGRYEQNGSGNWVAVPNSAWAENRPQ